MAIKVKKKALCETFCFFLTDSSDFCQNQHPLDADIKMDAGNLELGFIFLTQTGVGILGNSSLLCLYSFSLLTGNKARPTDLILSQLAIANCLVLLFKGIPQTIVAFGWKYFLGDAGCKVVFYFHRMSTGVSFSTLCLLNGFQAIKLNSHLCRWITLKIQSPKFISFCCFLSWTMHILINSFLPLVVNGPLNKENLSTDRNHGYCSWTMQESGSPLYTVLYFSPDLMSLVLMAWASGSMVLVLHRHKQRVQHIHSHVRSPRPSHEVRATRTILILVSSFVSFYSVYTVLTMWMTLAANRGQWIVSSSVLVASCFPALSPFVLLVSDTRVSQFCCRVRTNCFLCSG
ncbi:vomeronasal type-1 receptor 1 [Sciurus carolinensis]|uniref:vomeronasal type-1 receptor 1 n=1 Tax=Sciurus carolinensis TaxID=30640 RepID=UPI001FB30672|nr:vomeronasal type-1 receptor 1 [Sciurus carolinensis]